MLRNYFKSALRILLREKVNTFINLAGLSLGITGSLILFLIVKNGSSYDKFHSNADRIYRVVSKSQGNNGDSFTQGVPAIMPEAFKNDFSEAEAVAITSYVRGGLVSIPQADGTMKKYEEEKGLVYTEPSFFKIFDRKLIIGSTDKALDEPNEAIISKKLALKYFGKQDAIGEILKYDNREYKISAVMEDYPSNTDFPFELMFSYITIKKSMDEHGWGSVSDVDNCYFLLKQNESVAKIEKQLPAFAKKYFGDGKDNPDEKTFLVQSLSEIHTDTRFGNYNKKMPKQAQLAFSIIAVFLLLTACINFINLTTAEAIKRTKEVGIRKALGSTRGQLVMKFIGETFLVTIISIVISLGLTQVCLGFINPFMEVDIALNLNSDFSLWIFLGALALTVSVLSGLYPAFAVSKFKPALAMKNQIGSRNSSGYNLRKGLVVTQFFISQLFIIGTIVLVKQMNFMEKQDIGFVKEAIITVPIPVGEKPGAKQSVSKMRTLKNEILQLQGVEQASLNNAPPSSNGVLGTGFSFVGKDEELNTQVKQVDGDYIDLFKINLLAGEKLNDNDTMTSFIVNEKLVKLAGFNSNEEIIGQEISFWDKRITVKGVVKDFNTQSLSKPVEPVVLFNDLGAYRSLSIKLTPPDMQNTIKAVQAKWEAAYPEYIFSYSFMDEQIKNLYRGEQKTFIMISIFSSVAIFIGCLGLFGLVTFTANQKTKEVGVRKVLGASVESIMLLFSKEFFKLIMMGFALSAPLGGFIMHKILEQYAYKITLGPAIFLSGLAITIVIAILTVGYRSFTAATANPVNSLRSE
jgi:putative ABC transport system permease protein